MSDDLLGEKASPPPIPTVTTALNAPTIFADGAWLAAIMGDVVRIQFIENQLEPINSTEPGWRARHVGTLAIPRLGFKNMVAYLRDMDAYFDQMDADFAAKKSVEQGGQ